MIAFDASFLILAFDEKAASKHPTPHLSERISLLLEHMTKARGKILIPTPALSEFLTGADISVLDQINDSSVFRIAPFDERAAIEAAELTKRAVRDSDKKDPIVAATWAKIKFDRQIVAIVKVEGVNTIYSTDPHIAKHAKLLEIECKGIEDLPLLRSETRLATQPMLSGITPDDSTKTDITSPTSLSGSPSGPSQGEAGGEATKAEEEAGSD
jgi:predicted nucleic acid-binding protein